VPQIREFASGVWEISKFGGTGFIWLFRVEVFTLFNCGLVTNIGQFSGFKKKLVFVGGV
jgi:hypothetical protein